MVLLIMKEFLSYTLFIPLFVGIPATLSAATVPPSVNMILAAKQQNLSEREAVAIAQQHANGRVLAINRSNAGGRSAYRIKILSGKGDVRIITVDAHSGAVISKR